jgi:hypothetical protein
VSAREIHPVNLVTNRNQIVLNQPKFWLPYSRFYELKFFSTGRDYCPPA